MKRILATRPGWLAALASGMDWVRSLRVGCGMISRGEVGLIVTAMGASTRIFGQSEVAVMVAVVLLTTLLTPLVLRGAFRFLAGIGIGGEWSMGGTFIAEEWPEDRRKAGGSYMHTGYYFGFFLAALANYTVDEPARSQAEARARDLLGRFPLYPEIEL